jgi:hypothetical protein
LRAKPFTFIAICLLTLLAVPGVALADRNTGGASFSPPPTNPTVATPQARLIDGIAHAPESAPEPVKRAIWAANRIVGRPYRYGGGHARVEDTGYDCSGTISYALIGAQLLESPLDSSSFMRWGEAGRGQWITVYTNPGHAFVVIAGLRLDTSPAGDRSRARGPRWRPALRSTRGFRARHPAGL